MGKGFRIQVGGRTYTDESLHELADDPNVTPADDRTVNVSYGENHGIQAGTINGPIHFGR
ncbi:hypothetical protein ACWEV3_10965 [Saccharopolyspora sp. NPDC003752]